jgi:hypothetical protein
MITNIFARIQAFIMCWDSPDSDSRQANTDIPSQIDVSEHAELAKVSTDQSTQANAEASSKPEMSKFVVRLPADLLEKLKHVSRHHNRSMNTEINLLLGRYIDQVKGETRPGVDEHSRLDSQLLSKLSALSTQKIEALLDLLD